MLSAVLSISAVADTGWPYYGGTQWGERHATLSNINTGNVAQLVPRRVLQLGQMPYSLSASPLVVRPGSADAPARRLRNRSS
jgi:glucose dehydrogenase